MRTSIYLAAASVEQPEAYSRDSERRTFAFVGIWSYEIPDFNFAKVLIPWHFETFVTWSVKDLVSLVT